MPSDRENNNTSEAIMKRFKATANTSRRVAGKMNRTEELYSNVLQTRKLAGEIHHWQFEAMALRLADRTTYTPDFFVILSNGEIEFHETKGFWIQTGRIKIKVAAELHPWFRFVGVQYQKKTWTFEEF